MGLYLGTAYKCRLNRATPLRPLPPPAVPMSSMAGTATDACPVVLHGHFTVRGAPGLSFPTGSFATNAAEKLQGAYPHFHCILPPAPRPLRPHLGFGRPGVGQRPPRPRPGGDLQRQGDLGLRGPGAEAGSCDFRHRGQHGGRHSQCGAKRGRRVLPAALANVASLLHEPGHCCSALAHTRRRGRLQDRPRLRDAFAPWGAVVAGPLYKS